MAYTPTVWETGDIITAAKLNKAENGIAAASAVSDAIFILNVEFADDGLSATVDKTLSEVTDAFESGETVLLCSGGFIFATFHYDAEEVCDGVVLYSQSFISPRTIVTTPFVFVAVDGVLTWTVPT